MTFLNLNELKDYILVDNYIYNNNWINIILEDNPSINKINKSKKLLISNLIDTIQYTIVKHPSKLNYFSKNQKIYNFPKERIFDIIIIHIFNKMILNINSNIIYKNNLESVIPVKIIIPITHNTDINISIIIESLNIPVIYDCIILNNELKNELSLKKLYNRQKMYFDNTKKKIFSIENQISNSKLKNYCIIL